MAEDITHRKFLSENTDAYTSWAVIPILEQEKVVGFRTVLSLHNGQGTFCYTWQGVGDEAFLETLKQVDQMRYSIVELDTVLRNLRIRSIKDVHSEKIPEETAEKPSDDPTGE